MTKLNNTIRNIAVASTLMMASLATTAQAGELSSKTKQDLIGLLGNAITSQVNSVVTEMNYDIERSISQSLLNLGQPEQAKNAKVTVTFLPKKAQTSASK